MLDQDFPDRQKGDTPSPAIGDVLTSRPWLRGAAAWAAWTAAIGLFADFRTPWLRFPAANLSASWKDLRNPASIPYEQGLLLWPVACYAALFLVALALAAASFVGSDQTRRRVAWCCACAGLGLGAVTTLMSVRYLGFVSARFTEVGPDLVVPGVALWTNLILGVTLIGVACAATLALAQEHRRRTRRERAAVAAGILAWAGLVAAALPPFPGLIQYGRELAVDEIAIAIFGRMNPGPDAALALALARTAAVAITAVAWLNLFLPGFRLAPTWLALHRIIAIILPFLAVAGIVCWLLYLDGLPQMLPAVRFRTNAALPVLLAASAIISVVANRSRKRRRRRAPG